MEIQKWIIFLKTKILSVALHHHHHQDDQPKENGDDEQYELIHVMGFSYSG